MAVLADGASGVGVTVGVSGVGVTVGVSGVDAEHSVDSAIPEIAERSVHQRLDPLLQPSSVFCFTMPAEFDFNLR